MAYDIGPRISIKGEKEFNNQMNSINQQLKELGLMKLHEIIDDAVYLAKVLNIDEDHLLELVSKEYANIFCNNNPRARTAKFARYNAKNQS